MNVAPQIHKQSAPIVGKIHTNKNQLTINNPLKPILNNTMNTSHRLSHRLATQPVKQDSHWQFIQSRRQSHLNSLFNRRKTILESISKKNRQIYQRIQNQQSHYQNVVIDKNNHEKVNSLENLTTGSRLLLALSRHALNSSNSQQLEPSNRVNKPINDENKPKQSTKLHIFKRPSKSKEQPLATIEEYPKAKIVESRLIDTGRLQQTRSVQLDASKMRACSVGRKRLQDVYTNF